MADRRWRKTLRQTTYHRPVAATVPGDVAVPADGSITTTKLGGDVTTAGKALLDDADAATQRSTLGLGSIATVSPTGTPTGSKFLRDDYSWQTASGAGASATTVEIDLGATAAWTGRFTITDAAIEATSKVMCWQAPGPYTGKGTRADEAEMQAVQVVSVTPAAGSASVRWQTPPVVVYTQAPIVGGQPASAIIPGLKDPQGIVRSFQRRLGKVRGNVKFSYVVFS